MQDTVRVWSAWRVLEGFVLSLSWKSSPCGGAWTEAKSENEKDSQRSLAKIGLAVSSYESFCTQGIGHLSTGHIIRYSFSRSSKDSISVIHFLKEVTLKKCFVMVTAT